MMKVTKQAEKNRPVIIASILAVRAKIETKWLGLGLWLLIIGVTFAWRAQNLDAFGLSNDEGAHLMWAKLAVEGYPLYRETYAVQAPLFLEPVGWAFQLAGATIQAGRWVTLGGFVLLAAGTSWLAHKSGGWPGAVMAALLLGVAPLIFTFSRLVMAEIPATAWAVASVGLALKYAAPGQRGWLLASGLALGLSFMTKALNPFVAAPVGLLLLWRYRQTGVGWPGWLRKHWQNLLSDALLWGVAVSLPVVAVFLIYGPAQVYDQLVAFRGDLRLARPGTWSETWGHFKIFFDTHWGFWLLALGGIISSVLQIDKFNQFIALKNSTNSINLNLVWLVWLIAGIMMLALHSPLFAHHFIVLLPPLILLAAGLVTNLTVLWPQIGHNRWVAAGLLVSLLLAGGALLQLPAIVSANQKSAAIVTGGREQQALKLLQTVTQPHDFVMGDSQLLIFMANRRTPPPLGDVALGAIQAGRQTSTKMIHLTERYQAPAVVQWSLRLPWLPEYLAWVEANYLAKRVWDNDHIIYFGQRIPADQPIPNERMEQLGDSLALRGFALEPDSLAPGQTLRLKVYWQTETALAEDYPVFTQLLDRNGALVASFDSQPLGGHLPTSQWPAQEIVTDMVGLPLPSILPPGRYRLITGMYLLETLERLPAANGDRDFLSLTTIDIQ